MRAEATSSSDAQCGKSGPHGGAAQAAGECVGLVAHVVGDGADVLAPFAAGREALMRRSATTITGAVTRPQRQGHSECGHPRGRVRARGTSARDDADGSDSEQARNSRPAISAVELNPVESVGALLDILQALITGEEAASPRVTAARFRPRGSTRR
ncbi:hypothetical protein ACWFRM_38105 [Streptomyces sp. NPDC055144]